jgi:DNA-binding MarR family transcriptional regulator
VEITEKEFAVINEIHNNHMPDQRTIATRTGISLGMTNLIIKRLINKGYIKAKQLNPRKIQYLLTPKGFGEKAKKSYNFTLRTIETVKTMKERIQQLILTESGKGTSDFIISGSGDLADIVELAFKNIENKDIKYIHTCGQDKVFLIPGRNENSQGIDVMIYLSDYNHL